MIVEICIDSLTTAITADELGANRVELCSALNVGGLTPSLGLIKACVNHTKIDVYVMIRHREGGFVYSDADIKIMLRDIEAVKEAGAHGVVFGCLTPSNEINIEQTQLLTNKALSLNLGVTFHRAFDFVSDPIASLETLIQLGCERVLTSGQQPKAEAGLNLIRELVQYANNRIEVMAGSGVNAKNAKKIAATAVHSIHFTAHKNINLSIKLGMGNETIPDKEKISNIIQQFK